MLDQCKDTRHVLRRVPRMTNLYAVDSFTHERFDPLARPSLRGMRENGDSTGAMNQPDRVRDGKAVLGDERRAPASEVSVERVAVVDGPAFRNHGAGHVRAPDGASS